MELFGFVFTIFFMLLGPVKIIGPFSALLRGADKSFKRSVALRAALIASAVVAVMVLAGDGLLGKYRISLDALRLSGGLVLLISALNAIFPRTQPPAASSGTPTAIQLAVSPVTAPMILPHAGIAAILLFVMLAPRYPGILTAVAICLAIVMVLDFLVMYFIDTIVSTPGLTLVLQLLGSVLVFMQVGIAIETMLIAFRSLGLIAS